MPRLLTAVVALGLTGAAAIASAQQPAVTGTATYRERIAMTETAVLEVTLEDVSRADAEGAVLARSRTPNPGQPPFVFNLEYDDARIDARRRYAVRARIVDGERVVFTTTSPALVITQGRSNSATVVMQMVPSSAPPTPIAAPPPAPVAAGRGIARGRGAAPPARPAPIFPAVALTNFPLTYTGTLPCDDCQGVRYHLNLFGDDSFFLRLTYTGRAVGAMVDDIGSWVLSSDRRALILKGSRESTEMFSIRDSQSLRKLDADGQEIASTLNYTLRRSPAFQPIDLKLTMRGAYRDGPEGRTFTECSTGQRWPVAAEAAYRDLDSAYRESGRRAGDGVIISLEGAIATRPRPAGAPPSPTLVVERVHNAWPRETCEPRFAALPLENTYWRLARVGPDAIPAAANPRNEPALTFRSEQKTFAGSGGCNRLAGKYEINGEALTMSAAGTMMACPSGPPTEAAFSGALRDTRRYRIVGRILEFYNERHDVLARFEAVDR